MATKLSPSSIIDHLTSLKENHEAILIDCETQAAHAREQLSHINALLDDPLLSTSEKGALLMRSNNGALDTSVPVESTPTPPAATPKPAAKSAKSPQSKRQSPKTKAAKATPKRATAAKKTVGTPMTLSLLPPYENLSKINAVAKVFQEHVGSVMHIDDFIERLYGELDPDGLKAERVRMKDVMARGIKRKLWIKAPKVPLSYILEAPAKEKIPAAKKKAAVAEQAESKKKGKKAPAKQSGASKPSQPSKSSSQSGQLEVLPAYQGQRMTLAVETILRKHQGQAMTAEMVLGELYGELDPKVVAVAKKRLHDIFSKGVKNKRWKRVPKRRGAYVLR